MHVESGYIYVAILLLLRVFLHVDNTLIIMNYLLPFFCLLEYIFFFMETPLTVLNPMVCILRASTGRSTELGTSKEYPHSTPWKYPVHTGGALKFIFPFSSGLGFCK